MSEQIPESIPTSADPRSKRPLKKRALSPRSQTASAITTLFAKPELVSSFPSITSASTSSSLTHNHSQGGGPPEIVQNVQGSSAGAGSGEFHVYKASRRREYERLRGMDEEVQKEEDDRGWEKEKREREERDREATRKKREKRERLKRKKGGRGGEEVEATQKGGKVKARVVVKEGMEGLGGEGEEVGVGEGMKGVVREEERGVIIHDDD